MPGHLDSEIRSGGGLKKKFCSALDASFWSKHRQGGGAQPQAPPLDPPLVTKQHKLNCLKFLQGTTEMVIF